MRRVILLAVACATAAGAQPYGLIGRITAKPGQRDALVAVLTPMAAAMPGNRAYLVAKDKAASDVIWVTESWDSKETHAASLQLPAVRAAIAAGRPMIADFQTIAETEPGDR